MLGGKGSMKSRKTIAGRQTPTRCHPPSTRASAASTSGMVAASTYFSFHSNSRTRSPRTATSGTNPHQLGASFDRSSKPRRSHRITRAIGITRYPYVLFGSAFHCSTRLTKDGA